MIKYKKMSLFDAPEGSVLVHSVNCQGIWGSGIAKQFKQRFPESYIEYREDCEFYSDLVGGAKVYGREFGYNIGCLFTSNNFGEKRDNKEAILIQTTLALRELCFTVHSANRVIYSNKFNSGLFGVPWEETEKILNYFVKKYNLDWTVTYLE